jgi:hypothetical protein
MRKVYIFAIIGAFLLAFTAGKEVKHRNQTKPHVLPSCGITEPISEDKLRMIAALENMPTIKKGRNADLKYQDARHEIWLMHDSSDYWMGVKRNGKWIDSATGVEY